MTTTAIDQDRHFRGRLARRIFINYLLVSMLVLVVTGGLVFGILRRSEQAQTPVLQALTLPYPVILGILMTLLLIIGLVLWASTHRLLQPLQGYSEALERLLFGSQVTRLPVRRNDEIGRLAHTVNLVAEEHVRLKTTMESQVQAGLDQFRTSAELAQVASSSASLDELLPRALKVLAKRFSFFKISVYLLDEAHEVLSLRYSTSPLAADGMKTGTGAGATATPLTAWVVANNQARIDKISSSTGPSTSPSEAIAEVGIPIRIGDQVLGAFHFLVNNYDQVHKGVTTELQHLASQIAPAIRSLQLMELTQVSLEETALLYQASFQIAQAGSIEEISQVAARALGKTPFHATILGFEAVDSKLAVSTLISTTQPFEKPSIEPQPQIELSQEALDASFPTSQAVLIDLSKPAHLSADLLALARQPGVKLVAFLPVVRAGHVVTLLVLGARQISSNSRRTLTTASLQPYTNLIELLTTSLEKVRALEAMRGQLSELQTLQAVSQAISRETDLGSLYGLIHRQVTQVMGEVSFLIALYDTRTNMVSLPYMIEAGQPLSVEPFPLGEGLTSILIKTRQPLLLAENAEEQLLGLGAKVVGRPARSWLGVPLMIGGEVIGAIIVQDVEQEKRFDQNDLRLLTTLASQIAVVVRNASLLEVARKQAERERQLFDITSKIRRATDIPSILRITTEEVSHALEARRAHMTLQVKTDIQGMTGTQGESQ